MVDFNKLLMERRREKAMMHIQFMQKYQSHKIVHAAKITEVLDSAVSFHYQASEIEVVLGSVWIEKHKPEVGGYLVVYADGYQSYSPGPIFEEGNSLVQ